MYVWAKLLKIIWRDVNVSRRVSVCICVYNEVCRNRWWLVYVPVCMYVYFNEWRSDRVPVRLGLDTLIELDNKYIVCLCMYVCMCVRRLLGHGRSGGLPEDAPQLLLPSPLLRPGIRRHQEGTPTRPNTPSHALPYPTLPWLHPAYLMVFQQTWANLTSIVIVCLGQVTYQHLSEWYSELRENCPDIPCLLVANKIDVDYNV